MDLTQITDKLYNIKYTSCILVINGMHNCNFEKKV